MKLLLRVLSTVKYFLSLNYKVKSNELRETWDQVHYVLMTGVVWSHEAASPCSCVSGMWLNVMYITFKEYSAFQSNAKHPFFWTILPEICIFPQCVEHLLPGSLMSTIM